MLDKGLLLAGVDYGASNGVVFKHPKLEIITQIGINNYFSFMGLFMVKPHEIMVELDDRGIDFESVTSYDLFKTNIKENYKYYNSIFPILSNIRYVFESDEYIYYVLSDDDTSNIHIFTEELFDEISLFVREIHMRNETKPPKFKNSSVKEIYIEIEREEREFKKSPDFSRLISSLVWCDESSYKYSDIWELNMFQFYNGIKTVTDSKDFKTITHGLYSGTIDQKSINNERLNWIRS